MKIIIVNDYANVEGGASQVAISSARGLAEAGYEVTFIYVLGEVDSLLKHSNITLVGFGGYDLLSNPNRINASISGIWNDSAERQMNEYLKSFDKRETVIHIHSWIKSFSASILNAVITSKLVHVLTLHDYFGICPNGGLYNYRQDSICPLKPMSMACMITNCDSRSYVHKIWRVIRQTIFKRKGLFLNIKNFIFVSQFSKDVFEPYLLPTSRRWTIPNPIAIRKKEPAHPEMSSYFSFVGRLSLEKGADLFAQAVQKLDIKARFVGAGDMDKNLGEFKQNAEFTGWASGDEVQKYISDSRALVFPSKLYETQGMVVLEASALGIPSIVSDVCAASKFIDDGETGLLFESGNVKSLRQQIKLLDENPELANELGLNAYKKYWQNPYDMQKHIDSLIGCYQSILSDEMDKERL